MPLNPPWVVTRITASGERTTYLRHFIDDRPPNWLTVAMPPPISAMVQGELPKPGTVLTYERKYEILTWNPARKSVTYVERLAPK